MTSNISTDLPRGTLYAPPSDGSGVTPTWTQGTRRGRSHSSASSTSGQKTDIWAIINKILKQVLRIWKNLSLIQKVVFVIGMIVLNVLLILGLIYHEAIFHWFTPIAKKWHDLRGGWIILFIWTFFSAFPPLIGYSTSVTLAGFIYGFPNGWFIAAAGTVIGSTSAFIACRLYFRNFAQKMVNSDKRFAALSLTLKHDGLKLLCMIRLCPLPYSISNAALSTFPTVSPLNFAIATSVAAPKLMIHVFIGSRMAALGESEKMPTSTKVLNYASMIFGAILGIAPGYIIYQRTIRRTKQLEAEERRRAREGLLSPTTGRGEAANGSAEGGGIYVDDPEEQAERTLAREEPGYVDDETDNRTVKTGFAGRALRTFNDLLGRNDDGESDAEHERFLDGDETGDEDAEELLVVEDDVIQLEDDAGRRSNERTDRNKRDIRR